MCGKLSYGDSRYPILLREIPDRPKTLYYKGNIDEIDLGNCVSIVGSRRMTPYGEDCVAKFCADFSRYKLAIASGFMFGIDALAHENALKQGIKTIAVMPCGIDLVIPSFQHKLYRNILDSGGLILSEYPDYHPPKVWTYVRRNRIVAGISKGVLVVEAGLNSGSIITGRYALKYGRSVFVVPGVYNAGNFSGIYQLYKDGAKFVVSGDQVAEDLGFIRSGVVSGESTVTGDELNVLNVLREGCLTIDELSIALKMPLSSAYVLLGKLAFQNQIIEKGGYFYIHHS